MKVPGPGRPAVLTGMTRAAAAGAKRGRGMCRCRPPQAAAVGYNMRSRVTSGEHGSCRVPRTDTAAVPSAPAAAGLRPAATIMAPAPDTSVLLPIMWGHSSAGRVAASHAAGRGFEPRCLHHPTVTQSMPHAALRAALCPALRPWHGRSVARHNILQWHNCGRMPFMSPKRHAAAPACSQNSGRTSPHGRLRPV